MPQVRDMLQARLPKEVVPEVAVASAIYNLDTGKVDFLVRLPSRLSFFSGFHFLSPVRCSLLSPRQSK